MLRNDIKGGIEKQASVRKINEMNPLQRKGMARHRFVCGPGGVY